MNQHLRQNHVSFWTLMVCLIGAVLVALPLDAAAYQQDPTWIYGIYDAADLEDDGDNVGTRAPNTPATTNGAGLNGHLIKVDSFEGLTRFQFKEHRSPDALPDVRVHRKLLSISLSSQNLSLPPSVHSLC
jgi:hypothetical protein